MYEHLHVFTLLQAPGPTLVTLEASSEHFLLARAMG